MPLPAIAVKVGLSLLQTKQGRAIIAGVVVGTVGLVGGGIATTVATVSSVSSVFASNEKIEQDNASQCLGDDVSNQAEMSELTVEGLTPEQIAIAATIIGVAKSATVDPDNPTDEQTKRRAATIAIATAMQESKLANLDGGDRDSIGVFQQRSSQAWGDPAQIKDVVYATTAFFYGAGTNKGLVDITDWTHLALTEAAQAVQRSGFPYAYAQWEDLAKSVVEKLWSTTAAIPVSPALARTEFQSQIAAGGPSACGGNSALPATGTVELKPWGGPPPYPNSAPTYQNGRIPLTAMCTPSWAPGHYLRCDATAALELLNEKYKADHGGQNLYISSTYRSYEAQVATKAAKGKWAATPGKSNHGFGLAVDFGRMGGVPGSPSHFSLPDHLWMRANGPAFGFTHPSYMEIGGSGPLEAWHWQYTGVPEGGPTGPVS